MGYSMWFMAAACLSGVGADGPVTYAPAPPAGSPGVVYTQEDAGSGHSLRQRLANFFHGGHRTATPSYAPPHQSAIMQSPEPRLADPVPATAGPRAAPGVPGAAITPANPGRLAPVPGTGLTPTGGIVPTSATAVPGADQVNKQYIKRVAIADDASWVIGQLHYVHAEGGVWVVRYAPLDTEDRNGGAVALAPGVDMSQLREGDLVFVKGHMLSEDRASKHVGAPLYHADTVDLNERPGEK